MNCPRCGHQNPAATRFCGQCGAGLSVSCPACRAPNPAANNYCGDCGTVLAPGLGASTFSSPESYTPRHLADTILKSRSALEGERKQVTVLFVDVAGFTALSARLDPEDVHAIMRRSFELMLAEVHRYEGTVNQFLGDGIMALFGAPIAHEDHARRGVYAALGIREALEHHQSELRRERGITFAVRQGLNTGLVVVGSIGSDLRMDYTAVGDTTNVAARLQQAAVPGQILVADAVQRLVDGYCETRALGERLLKGKTEPVRIWEIISARRARSRLDIEVERGLTRLVGRERELTQLADCFEKARGGHGQVVFVVGEPGIGKSRLLHEFRRQVDGQAAWLEGRCLSFGRSMVFHPLVDLLRRAFGIEDGEREELVIAKTERGVHDLGEDLAPVLPSLRYLLGVNPGDATVTAMDPQERRGELFQALRRFFLRAAERAPQIVVYEDIHWLDGATEEWLSAMMDSVPASRWLQIVTYRTGYVHPFGERSYYTRIAPGALSVTESVAVARATLAGSGLPFEVETAIARKAEGNPFFVEEMVKSLQESGATVDVPDTIQDVITARIDRLSDEPKRVLQVASAIGRDFSRRLLDRVAGAVPTGPLLRELLRLEFIHEKRVDPELEYIFRHALTQEVAYGSLLSSHRKELHRMIGLAIEQVYADRLSEQSEVLAYHFGRAEAWPKALEYRLKAAEKAAASFATREAIAFYDQAEEAMDHLGDGATRASRLQMLRARADLYVLVSDFERARAESERARELAREAADPAAEGAALAGMALASLLAHRFDQALDDGRRAITVGEASNAPTVLAGGHLVTALVYELTGRLDEAREQFDTVIAISRPARDVANEATAVVFAAELESWEGKYDTATRLYDQGIRLARAHGVLVPVLEGLFMAGVNFTGKGDYDSALSVLEDGLALAQKVGDENYTPRYLNSLGWLYMECGGLDRALELNRRAAEQAWKRGSDHESIANADLNVADIALQRGDLALAREFLERIHRLVDDPATSEWMRWRYRLHLYASLADLALVGGDLGDARRFAERCLAEATRTRSRKYIVRGRRLLGEIALARRQWADAAGSLHEALTVATAIGNPTQLWKTHLALARLANATGNAADARRESEAAGRVVGALETRVRNPELRALLRENVKLPDVAT